MTTLKDSRINDKDKRKAKKMGYVQDTIIEIAKVEEEILIPKKPTKIKKIKEI